MFGRLDEDAWSIRGQEFVIGGYTRGTTTFYALVFGYYEDNALYVRL